MYNGLGQRVQKTAGSVVTTYVYDAFGNLAAEYGGSGAGNGCGPTCYVTVDHLGSTRLVTDGGGSVVSRYDYLPFGGELLAGINGRTAGMGYLAQADGFNPKFTGQIRDAESGLDYFHARYYSAAQGRFTSPDPGNAGAMLGAPQTWNMYGYVNNSPTNYTDPDGKGILSWLGALIGGALGGPIGAIAGWGAGTAGEAVLWGPGSNMMNGVPTIGSLGGCGGPLGNCGSINQQPWSEDMIGPTVQDPQRFVFTVRPEEQIQGWWETIQKHIGKIQESPNSTSVDHWRKEIRTAARSIWDKAEQVTKKRRADGFDKYLQRVLGIGAEELSNFLRTPIIIIDPCVSNLSLAACRKPLLF